MKQLEDILGNYLAEQVALEERLYKEVEQQLAALNGEDFADVNDLLSGIKTVLGKHFARLNGELDRLEEKAHFDVTGLGDNTWEVVSEENAKWKRSRASQMLRDDYIALNAAAMGNTLLHTAALAANSKVVADVALEHLANITSFLAQMHELTPKVVARELSREFPSIEAAIGEIAARNAGVVWKVRKK
jgi:hypothetical protein